MYNNRVIPSHIKQVFNSILKKYINTYINVNNPKIKITIFLLVFIFDVVNFFTFSPWLSISSFTIFFNKALSLLRYVGSINTIGLLSVTVSALVSIFSCSSLLFIGTSFTTPSLSLIEAIGIIINAPTNTNIKSIIAIPFVINKSKNNKIAILITNKIQKVLFEFSFEIILDNGIKTKSDIWIEINASIP